MKIWEDKEKIISYRKIPGQADHNTSLNIFKLSVLNKGAWKLNLEICYYFVKFNCVNECLRTLFTFNVIIIKYLLVKL